MPRVMTGSKKNKYMDIPFDPDLIAKLLKNGIWVEADKGTQAEQLAEQAALIHESFVKLQKQHNLSGPTAFEVQLRRWRDRAAASLREDDRFSQRLKSPGKIDWGNFLDVKMNPYITNTMPEIDPNFFMQPEKWDWKSVEAAIDASEWDWKNGKA